MYPHVAQNHTFCTPHVRETWRHGSAIGGRPQVEGHGSWIADGRPASALRPEHSRPEQLSQK
jgi:hypothetical protein